MQSYTAARSKFTNRGLILDTNNFWKVVSFDQDWTNLAQFGKPRKKAGYSYEIVNYLLASHNADPNLKDEEGKTPLHYVRTREKLGVIAHSLVLGVC